MERTEIIFNNDYFFDNCFFVKGDRFVLPTNEAMELVEKGIAEISSTKVYLVETNNCEAFEDYHSWINKAFSTFRGASQWLINQGFEVYYETFNGKGDIRFFWQESDKYMARCEGAKIIEMEFVKE